MKKNFRAEVRQEPSNGGASNDNIKRAVAQTRYEHFTIAEHDFVSDPRKLPGSLLNDGSNVGGPCVDGADANFAYFWIGKSFYFQQTLLKLIKHDPTAPQQDKSARRQRRASRGAIEECHAEITLEIRNRL
jgi:hypothetical protein